MFIFFYSPFPAIREIYSSRGLKFSDGVTEIVYEIESDTELSTLEQWNTEETI